jgi:hypothetical protein
MLHASKDAPPKATAAATAAPHVAHMAHIQQHFCKKEERERERECGWKMMTE